MGWWYNIRPHNKRFNQQDIKNKMKTIKINEQMELLDSIDGHINMLSAISADVSALGVKWNTFYTGLCVPIKRFEVDTDTFIEVHERYKSEIYLKDGIAYMFIGDICKAYVNVSADIDYAILDLYYI